MLHRTLHGIIAAFMKKNHTFFMSRLNNVRDVQEKILLDIVRANTTTRFGREHGFSRIRNASDYRKQVPVCTWEDFRLYTGAANADVCGELVSEPVLLYEPTGGSTSGSKLVPYTARLRSEFNRGINAWIYDLYHNIRGIGQGTHYWSISPPAAQSSVQAQDNHGNKTGNRKPVGFNEDSEYLGPLGFLLRQAFVMPAQVKKLALMDDFLYASAYFLAGNSSLSLISVWSPDYLLRLLDRCTGCAETIVRDIGSGRLSVTHDAFTVLKPFLRPDRLRSRCLEQSFNRYLQHGDKAGLFAEWWPELALVSAWEDGASAPGAEILKKQLAHARFQGKGLLATEGIVSFPLCGQPAPAAAYTSHFIELVPENSGPDHAVLLDQAEPGQTYSVVMTTGGGLYRYAIGDMVRVDGCMQSLPLLRFLSRDAVSDLVGEKLSEAFVRQTIESACASIGIMPEFIMLSPVSSGNTHRYVLFTEDRSVSPEAARRMSAELARLVEKRLEENYHYNYAIRLGQLARVKAFSIQSDAAETFSRRLLAEGKNAGSIKRMFLDKRLSWDVYFDGEYVTDENNTD